MEAAARVFARRGYKGASFRELIAESGLTKGAFYFHFSSKEELALETMRRKQSQLIDRIVAEVPPQRTGFDRLAALLRARARALEADGSLWCLSRLRSELGAELGRVSDPSSDHSTVNEWPMQVFEELVTGGQASGAVRPALDARATSETLFASVIGMDILALQLAGGSDLTARTENLLELLRNGLEP